MRGGYNQALTQLPTTTVTCAFEAAWHDFWARRTEADFEEYRRQVRS
jgi:hypothetical protein